MNRQLKLRANWKDLFAGRRGGGNKSEDDGGGAQERDDDKRALLGRIQGKGEHSEAQRGLRYHKKRWTVGWRFVPTYFKRSG